MTTQEQDEFYGALQARDPRYERRFLYGVKTTGVYCRPTCASRTPLRKNVEFFESPHAARLASYRACRRCQPDAGVPGVDARLLSVCRAIEVADETPKLRDLARVAQMSPFHLQRRFKAALGVSPKQYAAGVKRARLRAALRTTDSVTCAIYEAGYGSASQAYAPHATALGMRPSEFRSGGNGTTIVYAIVASEIGRVLMAATPRGFCRVDIGEDDAELERRLRAEFPKAALRREDDTLQSSASLLVRYLAGCAPWPALPVDVRGSAFQSRVWEALRRIAPGSTTTYSELARIIGSPGAARAVASACAANPTALLIPCHRVVPQSGGTGGYRWDAQRKRRLLQLEHASA